MDEARRKAILAALEPLRARVGEAFDEKAAQVYSQGWVDKRRLLLAEDALSLIETTLEEESLDTRAFLERLEALLHRARDLAPGQAVATAAGAILEALEKGDPGADHQH